MDRQLMKVVTKSAVGVRAHATDRLRLRIIGFGQQDLVEVNQIVAAIDRLPNHHLAGLREIMYAPHELPDESLQIWRGRPPSERKGEFRQKQRAIVLYKMDSQDLFFHVLYHEIGHFVFFLALNSQIKKRWVTEIFPNSTCITPYGALNASEDFAESYACFMHDPERLQQLPIKFAYMRDWVFSGRPESLKEKN